MINNQGDEENDLLINRPGDFRYSDGSGSSRRSNLGFEMRYSQVRDNIT